MKLNAGFTFIYGDYDHETVECYKYKVYRYTGHQDMSNYYLFSEPNNNVSKIFHTKSSRHVDDKFIKHLIGIQL